ncbi:phage/plasmid replication protein, II/X family [Chloroflexota bacterium]
MLDWYSGLVAYSGDRLKLNSVYELTPEGEILWRTERKLQAKGSYDASVQLGRGIPTSEMLKATRKHDLLCNPVILQLSGNPSKFLQGHNVFGPSVSALGSVVQATVRALPDKIRPSDADSPLFPAVHRSRVDITTAVDLGEHRLVHEWLRTAASSTRSRHGRALVSGDTVYWGKNSRRWTIKAYCKFCELKEHPVNDVSLLANLREYSQGHLRLELCLRRPELKDRGTLDESLVWEFMDKIEVGVMKAEVDLENKKPNLPAIVEYTLTRWLGGMDVRHALPKTTFYRHRRLILEETGLDVSLEPQKKTIERVNFDLEYLKAHEVKEIPSVLQGYLFKPGTSPKWAAR